MNNRLDYPISYFDSVYDVINPTALTFKDIFKDIRKYDKYDESFRIARSKDKKIYDSKKKNLPCFVIGEFHSRKDNACTKYTPCICIDIDNVKEATELQRIQNAVQKLDYVFCSYYSISGLGLRVLIWTDSTLESHVHHYLKTLTKLEMDLSDNGIICSFDKSTTNPSRAWYITPLKDEAEFYLNPSSSVLSFEYHQNTYPKKDFNSINEEKALALCIEIIKHRKIEGRNNTVMQLTRLASESGVSKEVIIYHCQGYVDENSNNPFSAKEMLKTVESNMNPVSQSFSQLENYHKQLLGKQTGERSRFHNILEFVRNVFDLRYNEFSKEHEYKLKEENSYLPLNIEAIEYELFNANKKGFKDMLRSIIISNKVGIKYNPLKSYLDALPRWDEKVDHINYLSSFVETDNQEFWTVQFKKMIVRCLACSLNIIPFNKQVLCLLSEAQDLGKSSFLRFLCPRELNDYYQEYFPLSDKDSYKALGSNIYINLDEIDEFKSHELNKLKSWISKDKIKLRLPYGKSDIIMPRIANFFATGNTYEMLIDTHNVRWLNFKIKSIKHDGGGVNGYTHLVDINKVYAQAYFLLNTGFEFQMTSSEKHLMEERNRKYFSSVSVEQQLIQEYFDIPPMENESYINEQFITSTGILNILNGHCNNIKLSSVTIGRAMKKLGFPETQRRQEGKTFTSKGYLIKKYN